MHSQLRIGLLYARNAQDKSQDEAKSIRWLGVAPGFPLTSDRYYTKGSCKRVFSSLSMKWM